MSNTPEDNENTDIFPNENIWNIEGYFGSYTICLRNILTGSLIEIYLEGPSGWTSASRAVIKYEKVSAFSRKLEYVPRSGPAGPFGPVELAQIEIVISTFHNYGPNEFKCPWFEWSEYGSGDRWYPEGYITINEKNFKKNIQYH